ncbi:distal membrane arm assembly component 2 [Halictus rubicundus]|uniref:distal membrane arm assembly component 2 n=1 Tax=Halictus rubicundus TaxID=77578 RepID=UPI004036297E
MLCQVQRSACMVTEVLGNLRFCNKHVTIRRNFYNSKGAINFLLHNLRKKRMDVSNVVYKEKEEPEITLTLKDMLFSREALEKHHFLAFHFKEWWAHVKKDYQRYSAGKRYKEDTLLGSDIASTKFILRCGGRVKLYNQNDWLEKIEKHRLPDLPTVYDPDFVVESIDLKGYPIAFENWEYMSNLLQLRWLCVRGCNTVDDWVLDKIALEYPALEYLDVSDCIHVTERGLEALYKIPNLKKLIVTNFYKSAALELTCFMLEDINPYLKCEILQPNMELIEDK